MTLDLVNLIKLGGLLHFNMFNFDKMRRKAIRPAPVVLPPPNVEHPEFKLNAPTL